MPDFNRIVGSAPMPTTAVTGDEAKTLASLDPADDIMGKLFKAGMNNDLAPRWNTARLGTSLKDASPIAMHYPAEPTPDLLRSTEISFPCLFVHHDGKPRTERFTAKKWATKRTWYLQYILGPLDEAEHRKIGFATTYFHMLVSEIIRMNGHPAYAMDTNNVWPRPVLDFDCSFQDVKILGSDSGQARIGDDFYSGSLVVLETTELDGENTQHLNAVKHTGMNLTLGMTDPSSEESDMIEASSTVVFPYIFDDTFDETFG